MEVVPRYSTHWKQRGAGVWQYPRSVHGLHMDDEGVFVRVVDRRLKTNKMDRFSEDSRNGFRHIDLVMTRGGLI